jgi:hypothetical protein
VLDQPADRNQASQRPPRADHVEIDVGAVAVDEDVSDLQAECPPWNVDGSSSSARCAGSSEMQLRWKDTDTCAPNAAA